MSDLIRDAPIGQLIRYITRNRVLLYPEEKPDFQCPVEYSQPEAAAKAQQLALSSPSSISGVDDPIDAEKAGAEPAERSAGIERHILERIDTVGSHRNQDLEKATSQLSRIGSIAALSQSHTRAQLEQAFTNATLAKEPSRPIVPQRTSNGDILVDWYTTDDPENPQNWSFGKKFFASLQIYLYTLAVYMGSAIYTPSAEGVMAEFGVSTEVASFGLSLYVLAYGIGPLIFSPMSEIPSIGRNPPYMATMAIFVILCVPTALVDNFAGLLVLRFLQGFFGSPCLATGGASLSDMYSLIKL